MSNLVKLNITKNTFAKGSFSELPWIGYRFGDTTRNPQYLPDRYFEGEWPDIKVGDQVALKVTGESKSGKIMYVSPPDVQPSQKPREVQVVPPTPTSTFWGDLDLGPITLTLPDVVSDGLFDDMDRFERAMNILEAAEDIAGAMMQKTSSTYKNFLRELKDTEEIYKAKLKRMKELNFNEVVLQEVRDGLAALGQKRSELKDMMIGDYNRQTWDFVKHPKTEELFQTVYEAECLNLGELPYARLYWQWLVMRGIATPQESRAAFDAFQETQENTK